MKRWLVPIFIDQLYPSKLDVMKRFEKSPEDHFCLFYPPTLVISNILPFTLTCKIKVHCRIANYFEEMWSSLLLKFFFDIVLSKNNFNLTLSVPSIMYFTYFINKTSKENHIWEFIVEIDEIVFNVISNFSCLLNLYRYRWTDTYIGESGFYMFWCTFQRWQLLAK